MLFAVPLITNSILHASRALLHDHEPYSTHGEGAES